MNPGPLHLHPVAQARWRASALLLTLALSVAAAAWAVQRARERYLDEHQLADDIQLHFELTTRRLGDLETVLPSDWLPVEPSPRDGRWGDALRLADPNQPGRVLLLATLPVEAPRSARDALFVTLGELFTKEQLRHLTPRHQSRRRAGAWLVVQYILTEQRGIDLYQHQLTLFTQDGQSWRLLALTGPLTRGGFRPEQTFADLKLLEEIARQSIDHSLREATADDWRAAGLLVDEQAPTPPDGTLALVARARSETLLLVQTTAPELRLLRLRGQPWLPAEHPRAQELAPRELLARQARLLLSRAPTRDEQWNVQFKTKAGLAWEEAGLRLREARAAERDGGLERRLSCVRAGTSTTAFLLDSVAELTSREADEAAQQWRQTMRDWLAQQRWHVPQTGADLAAQLERGQALAEHFVLAGTQGSGAATEQPRWYLMWRATRPLGLQVERMTHDGAGGLAGRAMALASFSRGELRQTISVERHWTADAAGERFSQLSERRHNGSEGVDQQQLQLEAGVLLARQGEQAAWEADAPAGLVWPMAEDDWPVAYLAQQPGPAVVWFVGMDAPPLPHVVSWRAHAGPDAEGAAWELRVQPLLGVVGERVLLDADGHLLRLEGYDRQSDPMGETDFTLARVRPEAALAVHAQAAQQAQHWLDRK